MFKSTVAKLMIQCANLDSKKEINLQLFFFFQINSVANVSDIL